MIKKNYGNIAIPPLPKHITNDEEFLSVLFE